MGKISYPSQALTEKAQRYKVPHPLLGAIAVQRSTD